LLCPSTVSLRVPLNKKKRCDTETCCVLSPVGTRVPRRCLFILHDVAQQLRLPTVTKWSSLRLTTEGKDKATNSLNWVNEKMFRCFLNSSNYSGYVYVSAFNMKLTQLPGGLGYQFNAMPGLTFVTVEHHAEQATWWHYHVLWSLALDFHDYFAFGVLWSSIIIIIIYLFAKIGHWYVPSISIYINIIYYISYINI
jgi:hypothetical protein